MSATFDDGTNESARGAPSSEASFGEDATSLTLQQLASRVDAAKRIMSTATSVADDDIAVARPTTALQPRRSANVGVKGVQQFRAAAAHGDGVVPSLQSAMEVAAAHGMRKAKQYLVEEERKIWRKMVRRIDDLGLLLSTHVDVPLHPHTDPAELGAVETAAANTNVWLRKVAAELSRLTEAAGEVDHVDRVFIDCDAAWNKLCTLAAGTRARRALTDPDERRLFVEPFAEAMKACLEKTCELVVTIATFNGVLHHDDGSLPPQVPWKMVPRRLNLKRRAMAVPATVVPDYDESTRAADEAALRNRSHATRDGSGVVQHLRSQLSRFSSLPVVSALIPSTALESPVSLKVPEHGGRQVRPPTAASRRRHDDSQEALAQDAWALLSRAPEVDLPPTLKHRKTPNTLFTLSESAAPAAVMYRDAVDVIAFTEEVRTQFVVLPLPDNADPIVSMEKSANSDGPLAAHRRPTLAPSMQAEIHPAPQRFAAEVTALSSSQLGRTNSLSLSHAAPPADSMSTSSPPPSEAGGSVAARSTLSGGAKSTGSRGVSGRRGGPSPLRRRMARERAVPILQRFAKHVAAVARSRRAHEHLLALEYSTQHSSRHATDAAEDAELLGVRTREKEVFEASKRHEETRVRGAATIQTWWCRTLAVLPYQRRLRRAIEVRRMARAQVVVARWWRWQRAHRSASRHLLWWWMGRQRRHRLDAITRVVREFNAVITIQRICASMKCRILLGEELQRCDMQRKRSCVLKAMWKFFAVRDTKQVLAARRERVEALRLQEVRERAAMRVQSAVRGFLARRRVRHIRMLHLFDRGGSRLKACLKIQRWYRWIVACELAFVETVTRHRRCKQQWLFEMRLSAARKLVAFLRMVVQRCHFWRHVEATRQAEVEARSVQRRRRPAERFMSRIHSLPDEYVTQLCETGWDAESYEQAGNVSKTLLQRHMLRQRKRTLPSMVPPLQLHQAVPAAAGRLPNGAPRCLLHVPPAIPLEVDRDEIRDRGLTSEAIMAGITAAPPPLLLLLVARCATSYAAWQGSISHVVSNTSVVGALATAVPSPESAAMDLNRTWGRPTSDAAGDADADHHITQLLTPRHGLVLSRAARLATGGATFRSLHPGYVVHPYQKWKLSSSLLHDCIDRGLRWATERVDESGAPPSPSSPNGSSSPGHNVLRHAANGLSVTSRSEIVASIAADIHCLYPIDGATFVLCDALALPSRALIGPRLVVSGLQAMLALNFSATELCDMAAGYLGWQFGGEESDEGVAALAELCASVRQLFTADGLLAGWTGLQLSESFIAASTLVVTPSPRQQQSPLARVVSAVRHCVDTAMAVLMAAVAPQFLHHLVLFDRKLMLDLEPTEGQDGAMEEYGGVDDEDGDGGTDDALMMESIPLVPPPDDDDDDEDDEDYSDDEPTE